MENNNSIGLRKPTASLMNHLQVHYHQKPGARRSSPKDPWMAVMGQSHRTNMEWRSELQLAAYQIHSHYGQEPYLYMDGSLASQTMVQAFHWAQVPFKPVVLRLQKDLNLHAVANSVFCLEELALNYELVDVNLEVIFKSESFLQSAWQYSTTFLNQLVAIHVWQHLATQAKPLVLPFGIPELKRTDEGWKVVENEAHFGVLQFQQQHDVAGVPLFFRWSPELMTALMKDPFVKSVAANVTGVQTWDAHCLREVISNYYQCFGKWDFNGFEKLGFEQKKVSRILLEREGFRPFSREILYGDYLKAVEFVPAPPVALKKHG